MANKSLTPEQATILFGLGYVPKNEVNRFDISVAFEWGLSQGIYAPVYNTITDINQVFEFVLLGNAAQDRLDYLLQYEEGPNGEPVDRCTLDSDRSKGIFKDAEDNWVAYDNTSDQCNVEAFPNIHIALAWVLQCKCGWLKEGVKFVAFEFDSGNYLLEEYSLVSEVVVYLKEASKV